MKNKFKKLRELLFSKKLTFLMEGHNAISTRIAQDSGFEGIWASGLTIAASMGLSDRNEASWTQVLEIVELMADCIDIPVLMDGDTGFGNFNNVRRLVKKMCQKGIAGLCLEDKLFPKTNSFIGNEQILADVEEFSGKIKAAKDSQLNDSFVVVARVEALVSGKGMEEALERAESYYLAGADAILIHSKAASGSEVISFTKRWGNRCPVIIVPTKYYKTPTEQFEDAGISTVVWANHSMRASIASMKHVTAEIMKKRSVLSVEDSIASLQSLFSLTNEFEVREAEKRYLPKKSNEKKAALAALFQ